jgi:predicted CXXCH cytochrome family protein
MKKKLLVASLALLGGLGVCSNAFAILAGSAHDFHLETWGDPQICLPCHAPHNNRNAATELLWNHDTTAVAAFTLYSNAASFDAVPGQPTPTSKFCLSCHDGTVALDAYGSHGAGLPANKLTGTAMLGTDLSNDHPISFLYDAALVTADTARAGGIAGLKAPAVVTAAGLPLFAGLMECATCHDVHNKHGNTAGLLNIANTGSALCLACHIK